MALLYNPREMPDSELRATFVARQPLIEDLLTTIEGQPEGAGVQHAILVAPRGMGKTTILLMLEIGLRDRGMDKQWQVVAFPEESYGVYDLADFWMQTARLLASATGDDALLLSAEKLRDRKHDKDNLRGGLYALLKDWSRAHSRRLLLLVDNFDMILGQINDDEENASLRNALMNDGTIMLVGGATSFFREARSYDQPLYHFFKRYDLFPLSPEEIEELLLRRSAEDGRPDFEETLRTNRARVRALEYFTGGSPRLVLMLYRILTTSDLKEIRLGLEKLLDDVTPYYKARVEALPAQQRKILDEVARASIRTRQGVTPTALAGAVRMTPNQVSSQLKRLADSGYVSPVRLRGRESYYTLSEPLYAVWHQMRFGIEARRRMEWLVEFLRIYYSSEELLSENERLNNLLWEELFSGDLIRAGGVVELRGCVIDALSVKAADGNLDFSCALVAEAAYIRGDLPMALEQFDQARSIHGDHYWLCKWRGMTLARLGRWEEALASFNETLRLRPTYRFALVGRAGCLYALGRDAEALADAEKVINEAPADREASFVASLFACLSAISLGERERALRHWGVFVGMISTIGDHIRSGTMMVPLQIAKLGHLEFAREAIRSSGLEEQMLPLARALDHIASGDEGLIEKLSPEIKPIVKQLVDDLKPNRQPTFHKPKSKTNRKAESRGR